MGSVPIFYKEGSRRKSSVILLLALAGPIFATLSLGYVAVNLRSAVEPVGTTKINTRVPAISSNPFDRSPAKLLGCTNGLVSSDSNETVLNWIANVLSAKHTVFGKVPQLKAHEVFNGVSIAYYDAAYLINGDLLMSVTVTNSTGSTVRIPMKGIRMYVSIEPASIWSPFRKVPKGVQCDEFSSLTNSELLGIKSTDDSVVSTRAYYRAANPEILVKSLGQVTFSMCFTDNSINDRVTVVIPLESDLEIRTKYAGQLFLAKQVNRGQTTN